MCAAGAQGGHVFVSLLGKGVGNVVSVQEQECNSMSWYVWCEIVRKARFSFFLISILLFLRQGLVDYNLASIHYGALCCLA